MSSTAFQRMIAQLATISASWTGSHAAGDYVPNADPVLRRCDEMSPNAAVGACYLAAADRERIKVERAFRQRPREAAALDNSVVGPAAPKPPYIPHLVAHLRLSQAAWTRYVAAQCTFEGGVSFGGSGTDMLHDECRYRLYKQRLAELTAARKLLN